MRPLPITRRKFPRSKRWGILLSWYDFESALVQRKVLGHDYWVHDNFNDLTTGLILD